LCVTADVYVENCQYANMPLTGSDVSKVWGNFSQNIAADKIGFIFYILRNNNRKCHILCSCLLQSIISLFHLKYEDFKKKIATCSLSVHEWVHWFWL